MSSKPKILLIDEDPADRPLAAVVLSSAFSRPVCEVGDGKKFVAALKDSTYDAVVTELGIDGVSTTFQLEAICAIQPAAPVVVFTRSDDSETRQEALAAGAAAFVPKSTQGFLDLPGAVGSALDDVATPAGATGTEAAPSGSEPESFALEPLPPREAIPSTADAWRARLSPVLKSVRSSLDHGIGRGVAIFLGVVAVSALLSALFGTFDRDGAEAPDNQEATGDVLSAMAESDAEPVPDVPEASPNDIGEPNVTPRVQNAETGAPRSPQPDAPVTLELRATDDVWILVSVDGVDALDAIMAAGQRRSFSAQKHVELRVGNAAGLTVIWNGSDIGSIGRPDQVRRLHFTPTKVGPGPPPPD